MTPSALQHLCYVSHLREPDALAGLVAELGRFRAKNLSLGITGCIAFEGERIMQVLEGPAEAVEAMFETIRADPRHCGIIELDRKPVDRMSFRHWGMIRRPIADVLFLSELS